MNETILALFARHDEAAQAVANLQAAGYRAKDFSVITRDAAAARTIQESTGVNVAEGAVSGATAGGALGALAGLLIGVGAVAIPGIGAILIGGPLAAALGLTGVAGLATSAALTGALAGGLVGALIGLGVPEEVAQVYEMRIKEGGVLLAVPTNSRVDADAREILVEAGAEEITTIAHADVVAARR